MDNSKEHLELFLYRVQKMREKQIEYFSGKHKVLPEAKRLELQVDHAITVLLTKLGYSIEHIKNKNEQPKLL